MVRASGGEGGVPCLAKVKQCGGTKGEIMNRGAPGAPKGETSVDTRLVEGTKAQLRHPEEIQKGRSKFFCLVGAEGIR